MNHLETVQYLWPFLLVSGLVIRLAGAFCMGCQDMEWWKAFGVYSYAQGIANIYGATDSEILALRREGRSLKEITQITQRRWKWDSVVAYYAEQEFSLPHPPLFLYPIWIATKLYSRLDPAVQNNRLFNFFINLQPILSSLLLTLLIYLFVRSLAGEQAASSVALMYWLNPTVLLNSPIQGFVDATTALFVTLSLACLAWGSLCLSFAFAVCSFMHKALGVLVLPVILVVGLKEFSIINNLGAWLAGAAMVAVIHLPYIRKNYGLSAILGELTVTRTSGDISSQSMNPWWILQYWLIAKQALADGLERKSAIRGGPQSNWGGTMRLNLAIERLGWNPVPLGFVALLIITIINCYACVRLTDVDSLYIFFCAALQIYAYFICRPGVQNNHYFIMIAPLCVSTLLGATYAYYFFAVCAVFFIQDLIFYGLGRDVNFFKDLLSMKYGGWITVALSVLNTLLLIGGLAMVVYALP